MNQQHHTITTIQTPHLTEIKPMTLSSNHAITHDMLIRFINTSSNSTTNNFPLSTRNQLVSSLCSPTSKSTISSRHVNQQEPNTRRASKEIKLDLANPLRNRLLTNSTNATSRIPNRTNDRTRIRPKILPQNPTTIGRLRAQGPNRQNQTLSLSTPKTPTTIPTVITSTKRHNDK